MSNDLDTFFSTHQEEIDRIVARFSDFQPLAGYGRDRLRAWIGQFSAQHRELVLRFARCIQYYGTHEITGLLRRMGEMIDAQIKGADLDPSQVYYIAGGRTAESGHAILHRFRNINRMQRSSHVIDLRDAKEALLLLENPAVFFLDDFIATGRQMSKYWSEVLYQIIPEYLPIYFCVVAGFADGIDYIETNTPMKVLAVNVLTSRHQLLGAANHVFTWAQKNTLKRYCDEWGNHPLGFGKVASLVAFSHSTPNNAPSIIRGADGQNPMRGLLPGWDDLEKQQGDIDLDRE